ncbi:MAG: hypothetical protein NDJ89_11300 [Oligoflexia bacterium]|nr:hypothetical protein [Oligoflexia bacterium]
MATRKKGQPYRELGIVLEKWRRGKFRSALALFKEAKFSFSYSTYADFERGVTLPSPVELVELARFFGETPHDALLSWARVQMPSRETKAIFSPVTGVLKKAKDFVPEARSATAPNFENTWVFGDSERKLLLARPWLWEACQSLMSVYPDEAPFDEIPLPAGEDARAALATWISEGKIHASETGLKLARPHLYLPRAPEWEEVRRGNYERAFAQVLGGLSPEAAQKGEGFRGLSHRALTQAQLKAWVEELRRVEREFLADPLVPRAPGEEEPTYALMMVLGPRPLRARRLDDSATRTHAEKRKK